MSAEGQPELPSNRSVNASSSSSSSSYGWTLSTFIACLLFGASFVLYPGALSSFLLNIIYIVCVGGILILRSIIEWVERIILDLPPDEYYLEGEFEQFE